MQKLTFRNPQLKKPSDVPITSTDSKVDRIYLYAAYGGCGQSTTAGTLCTHVEAWNIEISQPSTWAIEETCKGYCPGSPCPHGSVGQYWTLVPRDSELALGPQESIAVTFSNLKTSVEPGAASFYVETVYGGSPDTAVVPVTVAVVAQPRIKSFSAELQRVGAKASVRFAWDAHADFITLFDDPTVLRSPVSPAGGYEIELGPGRPLQNVYTLTASSRAPEAGAPMASVENNITSTWAATGSPVSVGNGPSGVAVSPDGTRVFVANYSDNTVSVLDTTAKPITVIGQPIPVGSEPMAVAVSPDGTRVFVVNHMFYIGDGTLSILEPTFLP